MKQFGGSLTKERIRQYSASPNWKNGRFENLVKTTMNVNFQNLPELLCKQFFETKNRAPKKAIPVAPFKERSFLEPAPDAKMIWYGHSVVLMRINNKTLLIDPMLGPDASPIAPFRTKRFSENTLSLIDQLPPIDLVLLTHDHYDHLDMASIQKLKQKTKHYFVALGTERHLVSWGIKQSDITTFDWWQTKTFEGIDITFTPSRHFSGRGLRDRSKSLWGGWVFTTNEENIFFSGDGGFGDHFKEVGNRFGPFDIGLMECGQYNENWSQIHMYPEEAIKAAIDAKVAKAMPVHWGAFALAQHTWRDPVDRFVQEGVQKELSLITPPIGAQFSMSDDLTVRWWDSHH